MTVTDKTAPGQSDSVHLELDLRHAPAKVWRALTDPKLLSEWLLPVFDHKLEAGAAFLLKTQAQPGWDGTVNCRFVEIDEPKRISWRWVVGDIDTVVTFTLEPTAAGTRLTLVQSGFRPDQKQNFGGARYGLKMMSEKLVDLLGRIA